MSAFENWWFGGGNMLTATSKCDAENIWDAAIIHAEEKFNSALHITQHSNGAEPSEICPRCGAKLELVNCVYACTKCDFWEYSSS